MVHSVRFGSVVAQPAPHTTYGMLRFNVTNDAAGNDLDQFQRFTRSPNSNEILVHIVHPKHRNQRPNTPNFEFHKDALPTPKPLNLGEKLINKFISTIMPLTRMKPRSSQDYANFNALIDKATGISKGQKRAYRKALRAQQESSKALLDALKKALEKELDGEDFKNTIPPKFGPGRVFVFPSNSFPKGGTLQQNLPKGATEDIPVFDGKSALAENPPKAEVFNSIDNILPPEVRAILDKFLKNNPKP